MKFTMPCPSQGKRINAWGAEEDWECGGEIEVEITSYTREYPGSRTQPPEPAEVEWQIVGACPECGLNNDLTYDDSLPGMERILEAITEQAFEEHAKEEEGARDAAADRAYEEWKDRELGEDLERGEP